MIWYATDSYFFSIAGNTTQFCFQADAQHFIAPCFSILQAAKSRGGSQAEAFHSQVASLVCTCV